MSVANSSSGSIVPVVRSFPASLECLEDSNLPFCVTVTPLHSDAADAIAAAHDSNKQNEQQQQQQQPPIIRSLTGIPKCLQCGAPHACAHTHHRFTTTTDDDHGTTRMQMILCYLCGKTSLAAAAAASPSRNQPTAASLSSLETQIFELPLRLPHGVSTAAAPPPQQQQQQQQQLLYEVPATACPVLWIVVLDGGGGGGSNGGDDRRYWSTVSQSLQQCLRTAPAHVHVAIFVASQQQEQQPQHQQRSQQHNGDDDDGNNHNSNDNQEYENYENENYDQQQERRLAVYDLTSAVPHVQHYSSDEAACLWQQDFLEAVLLSAVPADTPHICTAVRSLMDYPTTTTTSTTTTTTSSSSSTSTTSTSRNNNNNNNGNGNGGFGSSATCSTPQQWRRRRNRKSRCPVAWTTEVVLAALAAGAVPAGQRGPYQQQQPHNHHDVVVGVVEHGGESSAQYFRNGDTDTTEDGAPLLLPYAGVKLTFLLADRPAGISGTAKGWPRGGDEYQPKYGSGGWGGRISSIPGERFGGDPFALAMVGNNNNSPSSGLGSDSLLGRTGNNSTDDDDVEAGMLPWHGGKSSTTAPAMKETELTPANLLERYQPVEKIEEYYADLGRQCADAAVGVDLLLLIVVDGGDESVVVPDFGLALIQPLADRSGAPGPLLFDLSNNDDAEDDDVEVEGESQRARFQRELLSRTPWQEGRVFGAELRIRLSPGFAVDPATVTAVRGAAGPQLAPLYYESGLVGPASAVGESAQLWRMGTTDSHTAFTIDLTVVTAAKSRRVPDRYYVEGVGEVALKPVIQTCFAYTTIVKETDESKNGGQVVYKTVRQMRIASRPVPLAHSVEALYASLDTEALAVVLFHKIALASFQDGLAEAAEMAQQWLQLLLVCVYRSAQEQLKVERQHEENGVQVSKNDKAHRYFYPGERLLNLEGELSAEDVLLAQGHERLRPVVLMVYLLLQCDPLRLSPRGLMYRPSFDLRSAALSQMTSMTPSTLTRCIAPRLQLWESGYAATEPILDVVELRSEAVQSAVLEYSSNSSKKGAPGLILFLDTPDQIVVMDARYVNTDFSSTASSSSSNPSSPTSSPKSGQKAKPLVIGEGLKQAIEDAANSYRTRPTIVYELDQSETSGERTFLRLVDCLIEDTPNVASGSENFADWKAMIAREVQT